MFIKWFVIKIQKTLGSFSGNDRFFSKEVLEVGVNIFLLHACNVFIFYLLLDISYLYVFTEEFHVCICLKKAKPDSNKMYTSIEMHAEVKKCSLEILQICVYLYYMLHTCGMQ